LRDSLSYELYHVDSITEWDVVWGCDKEGAASLKEVDGGGANGQAQGNESAEEAACTLLGAPQLASCPALHGTDCPAISVRFVKGGRAQGGTLPGTQVDVALSCRRRLGAGGEVVGAFFFVQVRSCLKQPPPTVHLCR
jgi:hypothetical protein